MAFRTWERTVSGGRVYIAVPGVFGRLAMTTNIQSRNNPQYSIMLPVLLSLVPVSKRKVMQNEL